MPSRSLHGSIRQVDRGDSVGVPVSLTALELVLEEIHLRRRDSLHKYQDSENKRILREEDRLGGAFSDEIGKDLKNLSVVHSSWTSICRHFLGRILLLPDLTMRSARAAVSLPAFGDWTRDVHLSFSRNYDEDEEMWDTIGSILSQTPAVRSFCLQTGSRGRYRIHSCVKKLAGMLKNFTRLVTLRLYCDILHGIGGGRKNAYLPITEHPSLFHALKNAPQFENLMLQNFLPCYKLVHKNDQDEEKYGAEVKFLHPSDPYTKSKKVESSSQLAGRIHSLAELIRSICNTPLVMNSRLVMNAGNSMASATFTFNKATQQFNIKTAHISHSYAPFGVRHLNDTDHGHVLRGSSFEYVKWCSYMKSLHALFSFGVFQNLAPFPSLQYLDAEVAANHGMSSSELLQEIRWFIDCLPPTLEVLRAVFYWEFRMEEEVFFPIEAHSDLDDLLASSLAHRCPNLKALAVDLDYVSELFASMAPMCSLIESCNKREIPLILHGTLCDKAYHGVHNMQEVEDLFKFENHI